MEKKIYYPNISRMHYFQTQEIFQKKMLNIQRRENHLQSTDQ